MITEESRRDFMKAAAGITTGAILLSVGALNKLFEFFFGPRLTSKQESELMEARLDRLQVTMEQRKLELERQESNFILVAPLSELDQDKGKYFTDYQMRPAMAFMGGDGLPIMLSAKCTHLGCTVGNQVNEGKVLCPCHVSFFDIKTGEPSAGSPAKTALPHLGWVVMDTKGKVLISQNALGKREGTADPETLKAARVYIAKSNEGAKA